MSESRPKLPPCPPLVPSSKRYVCIATRATCAAKEWQRPDGWQKLCDWIRSQGYEVVNLNGWPVGSIVWLFPWLSNCKLFIGLPSGLSWVAWALRVPVVMISGFSEPWTEFDCVHIGPPEGKCRGCFNRCEKKEWDGQCPEKKDYECTRSITPEMVQQAISERGLL